MAWTPPNRIPTVEEMVAKASTTVAGLVDAKRRIAVALRRHAIGAANGRSYRLPNLIVAGGTGTGKTVMVRALCEASGLPVIEVNSTLYSGIGWSGSDLSNLFLDFMAPPLHIRQDGVRTADHKAMMERWGVVIMDEMDKWHFDPRINERQTGRELQGEMLRIAEGGTVMLRRNDNEAGQPFNTSNILFIAMGAFEGIHRLVRDGHPNLDIDQTWSKLSPQHIVRYGFMEELAGRFSTIVALPAITIEAMLSMLQEQIWPTWQQRANDEGFQLVVEGAGLTDLAQEAKKERIGARSLEPLLIKRLDEAWAQAEPGDTIVLGPAITENAKARLVKA